MFGDVFRGKSVWISGHTGFKGSYLAFWLLRLGARVTGFALKPPTEPALFSQLALESEIQHEIGDVRDSSAVQRSIESAAPDALFHLAAQSLVRPSYIDPVSTFSTNTLGTINVLEALRLRQTPVAAVFVTSDKCYENREWIHGYRESDPLGGRDPYSASKAAAEIVVAAYRDSFFSQGIIKVASARAGNVIGGGDWAADRLVPDCVRALRAGLTIGVRNPRATRPWQHVFEPLAGYLWMAALMLNPSLHKSTALSDLCSPFNFGPNREGNRSVEEVVAEVLRYWTGTSQHVNHAANVHEASLLNLSTDKAYQLLGWSPVWGFDQTLSHTIRWYRDADGNDVGKIRDLTSDSLKQYTMDAEKQRVAWAL